MNIIVKCIILLFVSGSTTICLAQDMIEERFIPFPVKYSYSTFPGGEERYCRFMTDAVIYPEKALHDGVKGTVIANCIIDEKGEVESIKIVQGLRNDIDSVVVKALRSMPKWIYGSANTVNQSSLWLMPFVFEIPDDTLKYNYENREIPFITRFNIQNYPGGLKNLVKFITSNIKYPAPAKEQKLSGLVEAGFSMSRTGEIQDCKILQGLTSDCDNEVLRVLKSMPKWIPAKTNSQEYRLDRWRLKVMFLYKNGLTVTYSEIEPQDVRLDKIWLIDRSDVENIGCAIKGYPPSSSDRIHSFSPIVIKGYR